jgi:hypothetical protein
MRNPKARAVVAAGGHPQRRAELRQRELEALVMKFNQALPA